MTFGADQFDGLQLLRHVLVVGRGGARIVAVGKRRRRCLQCAMEELGTQVRIRLLESKLDWTIVRVITLHILLIEQAGRVIREGLRRSLIPADRN